jgi:polysaccharide export outer membrane protein
MSSPQFRPLPLILLLGVLGYSCVQNKKIVYLQKDDLMRKDLVKDSVVREYRIDLFEYRLQTNDIINVDFNSLTPEEFDIFAKENEQAGGAMNATQGNALLFGYLIDDSGEIPLPVIGKVKVAGLTVFEAQDMLQDLAAKYLESPTVKVRLLNFRFTILGEVNRQGTIVLPNNQVTLLEAIGQAGGLSDMADRSIIKILRQKGGEVEVQYINLLDENFVNSPYYYINQNDVLIVPALRQRPYQNYFGKNLALMISSLSLLLLVISLIQYQ